MSTKHPYTGLRPFQMEEADIFFGRGEQIDLMLHKLETHRFLAVVGASGSGKSSLVRAGLLPALRDGFLSNASGDWRFVVFRPGDAPCRNLAQALHECDPEKKSATPEEVALTAATLTASDRELVEAVRDLGIPDDTHLLVLVDQFEEIFRYRRLAEKAVQTDAAALYAIRDAATAFVNQLLTTARQTERTIYVVLTMRSDFLGDCDAFLGLPEAINTGQFLVPRLTREQMRATIVEPLKAFGADAEDGLVLTLLNDTGSDPDQLPLLQHTLLRLWLMREQGAPLSLASYRNPRVNGLEHSLSNDADEAFQSLTPEQQRIAEKMFRSLCDLDNEGKWTRRWMKLDDIAAIAGIGRENWMQIVPVVQAFIDNDRSFLFASPAGPFRADTTIDISHEALIRQWDRMQAWLRTEQESIQQYRYLLDKVRRWNVGQAGLWGSPDLDVVLKWRDAERPSADWAKRNGGDFDLVQEFLQACVAAREQQEQEAEQLRQAREREIAVQKQQLEQLQQKEAHRAELQKTRRGRAELLLVERAELWQAKPQTRRLPNLWEYLKIQVFTRSTKRTVGQCRMMRAANRYHAVLAAAVLVVFLIGRWGLHEWDGRLKAHALRDQLLSADTPEVPDVVKSMTRYRHWLDPRLREDYKEAKARNDVNRELHTSLALLPADATQVPILYALLLEIDPYQVVVVREALAPYKADLLEKLWENAEKPAADPWKHLSHHLYRHRLNSAAALAEYDPNNPRWTGIRDQITRDLVREPGMVLVDWVKTLRPVRDKLIAPLSAIYRDATLGETERSIATDVVAEYAKDQPAVLAELLMDADERQFAVIYAKFKDQSASGLPILSAEIDKKLPAELPLSDVRRETLAKRQANALVALFKMNQHDRLWPLLKHSSDPRLRSYLVNRLAPLGAEAAPIVKRLNEEPDISIRRALILTLGEFGVKDLSSEDLATIVAKGLALYRTEPGPGQHAAAEWLLRQWGHEAWLKQLNDQWAKDKDGREKKIAEIKELIVKEKENAPTRWYINGQGQTMVVIPGPVEFIMGSPATETDREEDHSEQPHKRRIGRTFAIAAKMVTVDQYRKFDNSYVIPAKYERREELPDLPAIKTTWHQAAAYCNWLSKEEGIDPKQWCYELVGKEVKLKPNYLSLTGYRLPTEAEMEYATRARAATARFFGESDSLLPKYARLNKFAQTKSWATGSLKPNDFGLFDVHGQVFTWCQERYKDYPPSQGELAIDDTEDDSVDIGNSDIRVLRGGSFGDRASSVRCAYRYYDVPTTADPDYGFRLARTLMVNDAKSTKP